MSYVKQWVYEIVPEGSCKVIRNCPGCRRTTSYQNTNCFRINANGSKIDVWLIYHCSVCKHTLNLTIYERKQAGQIDRSEYQKFMANNKGLAEAYGRDKRLFASNKAETDCNSMKYRLRLLQGDDELDDCGWITIKNPFQLKVRADKLMAELLCISRSREKELEKSGSIIIDSNDREEIRVQFNLLDIT
ncbi:MAG: DUF1062 domain-containing protein [Lachnospiraceae bacterium]